MRLIRTFGYVFLLIFFSASNSFAASNDWKYQDVKGYKSCVKCHEEQVKIWRETKHFKGFKSLTKNSKTKDIALAMGIKPKKVKKSTLCAQCHFTLGNKKGKPRPISGVSCESCHGPGKKWLDVHNDFGGKGVKRKYEAPLHRSQRHAKQDELGMVYPGNTYQFAKNCLNCHMVNNEELINKSKHPIAVKFDLAKRSQGKLRHGPKASITQIRKLKILKYAVELELGISALATADKGRFANSMQFRVATAIANLEKIQQVSSNDYISKLLVVAKNQALQPGNEALKKQVKSIIELNATFSKHNDGTELAILDDYQHVTINLADINQYINGLAKIEVATLKPQAQLKPASVPEPLPIESKPIPLVSKPVAAPPKPAIKQSIVKAPKQEVINLALAGNPAKRTQSKLLSTEISTFDVLMPLSQALCETNNPWVLGKNILQNGAHVNSEDCFSLQVKTNVNSEIYIYSHSENGKAFLLFPNACNGLGVLSNKISAQQVLKLPVNKRNQLKAIGFDGEPGLEWLHVIAITSQTAKNELLKLTEDIPDVCDTTPNVKFGKDAFLQIFSRLSTTYEGAINWQTKEFIHD